MSQSTCSVAGCVKKVDSRAMCQAHYKRWKATGAPERPCLGCGCDLTNLTVGAASYCGDQCRPECRLPHCARLVYAKHDVCRPHLNGIRRNGGRDPEVYVPAEKQCIVCGARDWPDNWLRTYCSQRCAALHYRYGEDIGREAPCAYCGKMFSLFVRSPKSGRKKRADAGTCGDCGRPRNAMTAAELAERDGEACALCGDAVDMSLPWPDGMSPSVDHVIPYYEGGENAPSNCALSHLVCNLRKNKNLAHVAD